MLSVPDTWVVIPLFNEAAVIGDVVKHVVDTFPDVVCVDDGSTDGSADAGPGGRRRRRPAPGQPGPGRRAADRHLLRPARPADAVRRDLRRRRPAPGRRRACAMVERLRRDEADVVFGSRFLDHAHPVRLARSGSCCGPRSPTPTSPRSVAPHRRPQRPAGVQPPAAQTAGHPAEPDGPRLGDRHARSGDDRLRYAEQPVHILYTDYSRPRASPC